ncbi:hypothetical protein UNDKW_4752 [Undibacterium sp. KW1]|nr:hypothetical protein UNDKW_4752 [Undibacterium sp. KW1]
MCSQQLKKAVVDDAAYSAYVAEARLEPQTRNVAQFGEMQEDTLEDKLQKGFVIVEIKAVDTMGI